MDAPDFSVHKMNMGSNGVGAVELGDENKTFVQFFTEPKHFPAESTREGREVWRDVDMVYVQHPGERDPIKIDVATHPEYKHRWPRQWAAYQQGKAQIPEGTRVSVLFPSNPSTTKILDSLGIYTVEQLANVQDSALSNIPFGGDLKARAMKYVAAVQKSEGFNKIEAQMDRKDEQIKSLEMQLSEMRGVLAKLQADREALAGGYAPAAQQTGLTMEQVQELIAAAIPQKRGPGRPPKEA